MAERRRIDQLDEAVEALMADAPTPALDPRLAALLRIGADLRDLPRAEFRVRLQGELQRAAAAAPADPGSRAPGLRAVTPHLQVDGADRLLAFLRQAFGAEEVMRCAGAEGIAYGQVRIGESLLELSDASAEFPPAPTAIHLYVPNVDAAYDRALGAGAVSIQTPIDEEYGDRDACVKDPFGNHWYIATHRSDPESAGSHVPAGLPDVMPYLHPRGAPRLIDFLEQAFAADVAFRHEAPDGTVVHAKLRVGDAVVEMSEAHGPYQQMAPALHLYVADADAVYRRALRAGATSLFEPVDRDYGERVGGVRDPFDNVWYIAARRT